MDYRGPEISPIWLSQLTKILILEDKETEDYIISHTLKFYWALDPGTISNSNLAHFLPHKEMNLNGWYNNGWCLVKICVVLISQKATWPLKRLLETGDRQVRLYGQKLGSNCLSFIPTINFPKRKGTKGKHCTFCARWH